MNVLSTGSTMKVGDALVSPNGHYRLELQSDGNLTVTGPRGLAWDTGTRGSGAATAEMQPDGNFVLYAPGHVPVWSSRTEGPGVHLVLQDDRNVVVLAADGTTVLWSPNCYVPDAERAAEDEAIANAQTRTVEATGPINAAPAAAPAPRTYTVERGDTLSAIAKRFYGNAGEYRRIAAANNIPNPDLIHPGQQLVIPD